MIQLWFSTATMINHSCNEILATYETLIHKLFSLKTHWKWIKHNTCCPKLWRMSFCWVMVETCNGEGCFKYQSLFKAYYTLSIHNCTTTTKVGPTTNLQYSKTWLRLKPIVCIEWVSHVVVFIKLGEWMGYRDSLVVNFYYSTFDISYEFLFELRHV